MKKLYILTISVLATNLALSQNVSIGHTSPIAKLDIRGIASSPTIPGNTSTGILRIGINSDAGIDFGKMDLPPYIGWIQAGHTTAEGTVESPLSLQPVGGNVGIGTGTSEPLAKLEVAGDIWVQGRVCNVTNPENAQDAATKSYVDHLAEMLLDAGLNGVVKDIDGNTYKTIKIGTQVWMAQDLKTTRYNNGTVITKVVDSIAWANLTSPAYCWYNNDSTLNAKIFGALYNYYTVADTNSLNVCPTGWHVPTDAEWTALSDFLAANGYGFEGSGPDIGKSMASTFRWTAFPDPGVVGNDQGTNNSCGFSGLPGGVRSQDGSFNYLGTDAIMWSSTTVNATSSWLRQLNYMNTNMYRLDLNKKTGFSVRCIRD